MPFFPEKDAPKTRPVAPTRPGQTPDFNAQRNTPAKPNGGLAQNGSESPNSTDLSSMFRRFNEPKPHIVFLLDKSGSMGGGPMEEMLEGCQAAVYSLVRKGCTISVITFSDHCESIVERTTSEVVIRKKLAALREGGGTRMSPAFLRAKELLNGFHLSVIHLITDGMPSDPDQTIEYARLCRESGIIVRCTGTTGADLEFLRRLSGGEPNPRAEVVATAAVRKAIEATAVAPLPAPTTNRALGPGQSR